MHPSDADNLEPPHRRHPPSSKELIMFIPPFQPPPNTINTGNGNDNVHISKAPGLLGALGFVSVTINGQTQIMSKAQLENTTFNLGGGNDTLIVDSNVTADVKANGGCGNDVMIGGGGDDKFDGGCGNDILAGRGGNDVLKGGCGNDVVLGGAGNDFASGGAGNDYVHGGAGNDFASGGTGNDYVHGGDGHDIVSGGPGLDRVLGGRGFDIRLP
jgi:Ca2+-binding RTX toxin-like protein